MYIRQIEIEDYEYDYRREREVNRLLFNLHQIGVIIR